MNCVTIDSKINLNTDKKYGNIEIHIKATHQFLAQNVRHSLAAPSWIAILKDGCAHEKNMAKNMAENCKYKLDFHVKMPIL